MSRHLPPLNGLRAFEAAARHLSFTQAAAELNVTQAAISHQIRGLEERLGVQLFVRRNRALLLSEAGQAYLPALREAFDTIAAATDRLLRRDEAGPLLVSTTASFATKWLVPRLATFQQLYPEIEVQISTGVALADFQRDNVDVAIRWGLGSWPNVTAERLFAEDMFPVCAPSLIKGKNALRKPADLARFTLLHMTNQRDDWRLWLTAAGAKNVDPARGPVFDHAMTVLQAAMDGLGVAIGHRPLVERDIEAGRLVAPFDMVLPIDAGYYLVAPPNAMRRHKVRSFRDWVLAMANQAQS
jgi:LysR family glycine cleavage system transcriptional activator